MNEIKIDKNIPMPISRNEHDWGFMRDMEIGDSFALPKDDSRAKPGWGVIYTAALRHGIKVAVRRRNNEVRVWRKA